MARTQRNFDENAKKFVGDIAKSRLKVMFWMLKFVIFTNPYCGTR